MSLTDDLAKEPHSMSVKSDLPQALSARELVEERCAGDAVARELADEIDTAQNVLGFQPLRNAIAATPPRETVPLSG
jgi:hypothetical protein